MDILTVLAVVAVLGVFISRKRKNKESTGELDFSFSLSL